MQKIKNLLLVLILSVPAIAQELPVINYSLRPSEYEIAEIAVTGAPIYDDFVLISFSGLSVGQRIKIPGEEITAVLKRFWKQGLFSDVKIKASKIEDDKIWLEIALQPRSKVTKIEYSGLKKSDLDDLKNKIELTKGSQLTPNLIDQTKQSIKKYLDEKGFIEADIDIIVVEDNAMQSASIVNISVDKKEKVRVNDLKIIGNDNLKFYKAQKAMKNTNKRTHLLNLFRSKKFRPNLYEEDKKALIAKYNEIGYRDARIVADTVIRNPNGMVDVIIKVEEGQKYYFRDLKWVGNTIYPSEYLSRELRIKKGDVYNLKLLNERLNTADDAVGNLYQDNGYLFSYIDPVEVKVEGDSIDFEFRIIEGKQAVINEVNIYGNDRVYEHVVRRELRTKPGDLYNKSDIIRTLREIAQMGHFDPEKLQPDVIPNPEEGTVDINYNLTTKGNDQIEFSLGYGQTGIIGSLALKFSNFAIQNLFKPKTYRIVPQGEGQTFSIRAQTNGLYYMSFSASFLEPWLGGKRPNSLSASIYYSMQSGVNTRYASTFNDYYDNNSYSNPFAYDGGSIYNVDPDQYIRVFGASLGFGKRLSWPDDYFTFYGELSYQRYSLKNWNYFLMSNGISNNLKLGIVFARNSIDNPIYTRRGSTISLSLDITPPYSLFSKIDFATAPDNIKYKWLEYHKWKFKAKIFTPLTPDHKLVLMARVEYGFLGYFNKNRRSPFETFYMGGDGMTGGAYSSYASETVALRGYSNGALTPMLNGKQNGNIYTRLGLELRYPIVLEGSTQIYALVFLEGGNCWADFKQFNPFDLKRSAGVGARLFLPMIGLLGIDWGWGFDIDPMTGKRSGSQFHFILGQEF